MNRRPLRSTDLVRTGLTLSELRLISWQSPMSHSIPSLGRIVARRQACSTGSSMSVGCCQRNPRDTTHISKFGVVAGDDELALALQNNGKGP